MGTRVAMTAVLACSFTLAACGPSDERPVWLRPGQHPQERFTVPDDGFGDFLAGGPQPARLAEHLGRAEAGPPG